LSSSTRRTTRRSQWPNVSREELVLRVRAWAEREGHALLVVFDGTPPEEAPDLVGSRNADDAIVELVPQLASPWWLVTSDRGLCGAYNANVISLMHRFLEERGLESRARGERATGGKVRFYVVGRKGYAYLTKRGYEVAKYFGEPPLEKMSQRDARVVAVVLANEFLKGAVSELHVVSTRFESMMTFPAARTTWLPLTATAIPGAKAKTGDAGPDVAPTPIADAILEPSAAVLLEKLVPKYLMMKLWNLLLESITAEYASKRVSMKNATDAADEMRASLQATYNRVRQDTITKQLMEIVSGAEALR